MIFELIGRIFYLIPKYPKTAQIGITNRCNFNCPMCQRLDLGVEIKDMDFAIFKQVLEQLKGIKDIILTGWGEPLIHPDLIEMIELCREKGLGVRFSTNGSLLNEEMINQLIKSKLDIITFSVDQIKPQEASLGHIISSQLDNIIKLKQKVKKENSKMKIYLQSIYHKNREQDILDVVDFAIKNELDRIRVSRLDIRFKNFPRPSLKEEKELIKSIEKKIGAKSVGFDFLPYLALDGLAKKFYKAIYPLLHRFGKYCLRTYNDVYININGYVTPCCGLPLLTMGNILQESLYSIWQGKRFKNFRKNQCKFCGKCDVLSLKPYLDKE